MAFVFSRIRGAQPTLMRAVRQASSLTPAFRATPSLLTPRPLASSATTTRSMATNATVITAPSAQNLVQPQRQQQQVASGWGVNIRGLPGLTGPRGDDWWTGLKPVHGVCPGVDANGKITSLAAPNLATCSRKDLLDYFNNTWTITEVLFSALQGEEPFYRPPYHHLRHPFIFYLAHPAALYINKFRVAGLISKPINAYFEHIFETGVDEMKWDDMSKNDMVWPSVKEVVDYRRQVYELVTDVINNHPAFETLPQLEKSPFWAVPLGLEHERIHIETSSVLMRELPQGLLARPSNLVDYHPTAFQASTFTPTAGKEYPVNEFVAVPDKKITLGKPRSFPSFGWDNEYGEKVMDVKAFKASKYKITNGEFLEFVKENGYATERYWTKDGWSWRTFRNVKWPTFWASAGPQGLHQYKLRCTFDTVDMRWDWPIVCNYHEAKAFAAWRSERDGKDARSGYRILTEAEHKAISDDATRTASLGVARDPVMILSGNEFPAKAGANTNLAFFSESPVTALSPSSAGFYDSMGNVWEWCEDHLNALPGFKIHPHYEDFSLPCFDGQHQIIMGGSFVSTGDQSSIFARYHFRPHFYQMSGFRLVEPNAQNPTLVTSCMDNAGPFVGANPFRRSKEADFTAARYNEQQVASQFVHLHFGNDPNEREYAQYPQRTAAWIRSGMEKYGRQTQRVLDLGCGPGGIAFQLSNVFDKVVAIDISETCVETAKKLQEEGSATYTLLKEGAVQEQQTATRPAKVRNTNIQFKQSDATCLAPDIGFFDAVVLCNVLDRLPTPASVLSRMCGERGIIKPGGLLFITSPFTWDKQFTPKELWIGGYVDEEGKVVSSVDGLKAALGDSFELVETGVNPCLIREHERKYQLILSSATVWRKRA